MEPISSGKPADQARGLDAVSDAIIRQQASPRGATIYDVWAACEASLKRFLGRFFYKPEDIEDLAQETFLRAFNAVSTREMEHPRAYLFRVAKSMALKELTRKTRQLTDYLEESIELEAMSGPGLEEEIAADHKIAQYCNLIANLPPQCRKVFLMRKVQGLSHKEICEALGISRSAVEKHIALGVGRIDMWLKEQDE